MAARGPMFFQSVDTDHDGKLSKSEAPERLKAHFDQFDKNHDGSLTPEEIRAGFAAQAGPHRPQPGKPDAGKHDK